MKTTYYETFAELETRIRRSEQFAIIDIINAKAEQYKKLLDNGNEIYNQALGDRWPKMHELRIALWNKLYLLQVLIIEIQETRR